MARSPGARAEQDTRMAEALGVSQQELGEFRQHGVITDKMAPAIGAIAWSQR